MPVIAQWKRIVRTFRLVISGWYIGFKRVYATASKFSKGNKQLKKYVIDINQDND